MAAPRLPGHGAQRKSAQAGFSTLEAIVALAILATGMLPLLTLQSQLTQSAARMEHQADIVQARNVAVTYLSLVNPADAPTGEEALGGGWKLSWQSYAIEAPRRARYGIGLSSRYIVQPIRLVGSLRHVSGRQVEIETSVLSIEEQFPYAQGTLE